MDSGSREGFDWVVGLNPNTNVARCIAELDRNTPGSRVTHDYQGVGVGDGRTLLTQLLKTGGWLYDLIDLEIRLIDSIHGVESLRDRALV